VSRPRGVPRNEHGALSPAVLILAIMIFWLAGLVIDGARQLSARSRAIAYAQEAARAGASGINLNKQQVEFDPKEVTKRVDRYCNEVKANDSTVTGCGLAEPPDEKNLLVAVQLENPTTFLSMLGVQKLTARGQGEAHAEQGINRADETPQVPSISVLPTSQSVTEDPHESASTPTFDPSCVHPTITVTETVMTPTPPPPADPTATVTVTVTKETPGPLPSICIPRTPPQVPGG
jgi:hypothetical protein